jgi:hypothetical protein
MPVVAATLVNDIIGEFPGDWVWDPGDPNYTWLNAICTGFQSMWAAGTMTPGLGPPPVGSYPHTHSITLVPTLMSAPVPPYTAQAQAFVTNLCASVANHLMLTTMAVMDGMVIGHTHLPFTFQPPAALAGLIISGGGVTGIAIPDFANAFATGLMNHMTSNAQMGGSLGGMGHTHVLL